MNRVDLNCDLGESFGNYVMGMDDEIIQYVSSVNIACGYHAGDPLTMDYTIKQAVKNGVAVGAHPGLPDLLGFGRREMKIANDEAKAYVKYQMGALIAFAKSHLIKIQHVKPHGALYNMAAKDYGLSKAICEGIREVDENVIVMGLSGSEILRAGQDLGLKTASEVFSDRQYEDNGTLVNRSQDGAVIHDKEIAIQRTVDMVKKGKVKSITGKIIDIKADSICVHGDNLMALEFVKSIRKALENEKIEITPLRDLIS